VIPTQFDRDKTRSFAKCANERGTRAYLRRLPVPQGRPTLAPRFSAG